MAASAKEIKSVSLYDVDHTLVFSPGNIDHSIEEELKQEVSDRIDSHSEEKERDKLQQLFDSMNLPIVVANFDNHEMEHFLFTDMLFGRSSIQERKNLMTILQYIYQVVNPKGGDLPDIEVITPSDLFWPYVYAAGEEAINTLWNKKLNHCHNFDALTAEDLISFFNDVKDELSAAAKDNFEQIIGFLKNLDESKQLLFKSIPGNAFATAKASAVKDSNYIFRCSVICKILVEKLARQQGYQHPKTIMLKHFKSRNTDLAITIYDDNIEFLTDVLTHFEVSQEASKSKSSSLVRKFKSTFTSSSKDKKSDKKLDEKSDKPHSPALTVYAVTVSAGKIQCLPATEIIQVEKKRQALSQDLSSHSSLFVPTRSQSEPAQSSQVWVSAHPDKSKTTI